MPGKAKPRSTSKWKPAPAELVRAFQQAFADLPGVEGRKMFGYPAAFVNRNMIGGLFQESMMLRLSERDRSEIQGRHGAKHFEPMPGRVMREYVVVPEKILESSAALRSWTRKALAYTKGLPAKAPAPKRKKA